MKLTELDLKIIRLLADDARAPTLRIAEQLGVPESTARGRIARMVENDVVRFVVQTDPIKMGYKTWVMIGLKIELPRIPEVVTALEALDEVYFVALTTGGFDVMCNAIFEDNQALHVFLATKLSAIPGIKDTMTFHYLDVPKRKIALAPPPESEDEE